MNRPPCPPRPVLLLVALSLLVCISAAAQEGDRSEYGGVIVGKPGQITIGIPAVRRSEGTDAALARELREVLSADLAFSGFFRPLEQDSPSVDPEALDLGPWQLAGAQHVLVTSLLPGAGEDMVLEGRLYEIVAEAGGLGSRMVLGKRYAASPGAARRLAHRIADEVVEEVTGQRGIARTRLAYVVREGLEAKEVFISDYDGQRARRITRTGTINLSPVWSPDGKTLAFLSFRAGNPTVFLLSEDGEITQVRLGGGDLNSAPDWSPEGDRLAFSSNRDGNSEVYLHDLTSGRQSRVTHHPAIDTAPEWSPSGHEIAFTSDRSGSPQIYLMDSLGANVRRLSYAGSYSDSAAWSPRGNRIAYVARIAGRFELVVHDLETGGSRVITTGGGNKENPRWSPDGRHLVFASNRRGEYALYSIHDDGTGLRELTRGSPAFTPDWSP